MKVLRVWNDMMVSKFCKFKVLTKKKKERKKDFFFDNDAYNNTILQ